MIDYKDRIAYYDRAFDAFNKADMDALMNKAISLMPSSNQ